MSRFKRIIPKTLWDDTYLIRNRLLAKKVIDLQEQILLILNGDYISVEEFNKAIDNFITNDSLINKLAAYVTLTALRQRLNGYYNKSQIDTKVEDLAREIARVDANSVKPSILSNFYNKAEIDDKLASISVSLFIIVQVLPENPDVNKVYLILNPNSTDSQNIYDEYAYINNRWEKLGELKTNTDINDIDFTDIIPILDYGNIVGGKRTYHIKTVNDNPIKRVYDSFEFDPRGELDEVDDSLLNPDDEESLLNAASVCKFLRSKQNKLIDGRTLKTLNNQSLLGTGNISTVEYISALDFDRDFDFDDVSKYLVYGESGGLLLTDWDGTAYSCISSKWLEDDDSYTFVFISETLTIIILKFTTNDSNTFKCNVSRIPIGKADCKINNTLSSSTINIDDTSHSSGSITGSDGIRVDLLAVSSIISLNANESIVFDESYHIIKLEVGETEYTHGSVVSHDGRYTATSACNIYAVNSEPITNVSYIITEVSYDGDIQGGLNYLNDNVKAKESKTAINIDTQTNSGITINPNNCYVVNNAVNIFHIILGAINDADKFVKSSILYLETGSNSVITITSIDNKPISYYSGFAWRANTKYELKFLYNGVKWIVSSNIIV